jgi:excisionase family DNA binding protein
MTYLRSDELAAYLRISRRSISNYVKEHKLPEPIRLGRRVLWRKDDIDAFLGRTCKPVSNGVVTPPLRKRGRPRKIQ